MVAKQGNQQYSEGRCRVLQSISEFIIECLRVSWSLSDEWRLSLRWVQSWTIGSSTVWGNIQSIWEMEWVWSWRLEMCCRRKRSEGVSPYRHQLQFNNWQQAWPRKRNENQRHCDEATHQTGGRNQPPQRQTVKITETQPHNKPTEIAKMTTIQELPEETITEITKRQEIEIMNEETPDHNTILATLETDSTLHSPIKSGQTPADYRQTTMVVQWTISGLPPEFC